MEYKKIKLSVKDLTQKDPKQIRQDSLLYTYYLITIAIFYAAPVIQLVVTNQLLFHLTGNQDLCFYNFWCSNPLVYLADFNHVFSNLGYILLGSLFIFIVFIRERKNEKFHKDNEDYGIPPHYGLYYAMGFAVVMQGVMSGSYHVCPTHSAFQFGMYIIISVFKLT